MHTQSVSQADPLACDTVEPPLQIAAAQPLGRKHDLRPTPLTSACLRRWKEKRETQKKTRAGRCPALSKPKWRQALAATGGSALEEGVEGGPLEAALGVRSVEGASFTERSVEKAPSSERFADRSVEEACSTECSGGRGEAPPIGAFGGTGLFHRTVRERLVKDAPSPEQTPGPPREVPRRRPSIEQTLQA